MATEHSRPRQRNDRRHQHRYAAVDIDPERRKRCAERHAMTAGKRVAIERSTQLRHAYFARPVSLGRSLHELIDQVANKNGHQRTKECLPSGPWVSN